MVASSYTFPRKVLHWLSAVAVLGLFASGLWMVELGYYDAWYQTAPAWHVNVGVALFIATLARFLLQPRNPKIVAPPAQRIAARLAHASLLVCIILLTLTGYGLSTADGRPLLVLGLEIPGLGELIAHQSSVLGEWHLLIAYATMALSSLHAVAAFKHHFIDRDDTLKRMLFN